MFTNDDARFLQRLGSRADAALASADPSSDRLGGLPVFRWMRRPSPACSKAMNIASAFRTDMFSPSDAVTGRAKWVRFEKASKPSTQA